MEACASEVSRFFNESLKPHFEAEETVLFPLMAVYEGSRALVARLESEHQEFRRRLARPAGDGGLRKFLFDFGDLLEQHIRSEERGLFSAFEALVPVADAERAGHEIKRILERSRSTS